MYSKCIQKDIEWEYVNIYSPSGCSKPMWLTFFCWTFWKKLLFCAVTNLESSEAIWKLCARKTET